MRRLSALAMGLFLSPPVMLKWIQIRDPYYDMNHANFDLLQSEIRSPIYYACLLGLPDIVSRLIHDGQVIDHVSPAAEEDLETVCLLLYHEAKPNLHGGDS